MPNNINKNIQDKSSVQIPQSQNLDNEYPYKDNLRQPNQTIPTEVPIDASQANINDINNDININNNNNQNEREQSTKVKNTGMRKRYKIVLVLTIILILFCAGDIFIEIFYKIFTPYLVGDNVAIFIMFIVYIIFIILKKEIENPCLGAISFLVIIVGFIIKGYGFFLLNKPNEKPSNAASGSFFISLGKFYLVVTILTIIYKDVH